jgi:alpha-ketoglutarate-dependent taurine dioxygenase
MIIILLIIFAVVNSYKFSKPYNVPWVCQLDDIDVRDENNLGYIKSVFNRVPIIIFKNQEINSLEYYNFVKYFDKTHDENEYKYHPFEQDNLIRHVGLRDNSVTSEHSRYNNLWHMDMIGTGKLPNVVSSLYFENVPINGGETMFCNLENAYAKIDPVTKIDINHLVSVYDKSNIISPFMLDANGFRKLNHQKKLSDEIILRQPFVFYPNPEYTKKSILFSPFRFNNFEGLSSEQSWDLLDYIFIKYINTDDNTVSIKWEKNDLVIFNNRLLLHSSTASEVFKDESRFFKIIFLNTQVPIRGLN